MTISPSKELIGVNLSEQILNSSRWDSNRNSKFCLCQWLLSTKEIFRKRPDKPLPSQWKQSCKLIWFCQFPLEALCSTCGAWSTLFSLSSWQYCSLLIYPCTRTTYTSLWINLSHLISFRLKTRCMILTFRSPRENRWVQNLKRSALTPPSI